MFYYESCRMSMHENHVHTQVVRLYLKTEIKFPDQVNYKPYTHYHVRLPTALQDILFGIRAVQSY